MTLSKVIAVGCCLWAASASAVTYEDWSSPQVSYSGTLLNDGTTWLTDPSKRWAINNWRTVCGADPAGPNRCYLPGNGQLGMHAEGAGPVTGEGFTFGSTNPISFTNGITIEAQVTPHCYQGATDSNPSRCGFNLGLWESERNYRSIGFKSYPGSSDLYLNLWGPTTDGGGGETSFNGTAPYYNSIPTPAFATYTVKVQYWNSPSGWRWDYFLNGNWVAGQSAIAANDQYHMGPGYFPSNQVRLQFTGFSYNPRPDNLEEKYPWSAFEGQIGPITYTTF
ncbi:hypothetical protein ACFPOE_07045 [Caenimonas terrae]|uniref:GH16 domain-containing protein n=1 Tax=Caenimonas terrae TaxID=696074 RepID=A0ABW0NBR0_9BURK